MKLLLLSAALLALAGCETPRPRPPVTAPGGASGPCETLQGNRPIADEIDREQGGCR